MYISLNNLGSMVLDINGNRMDAKFLRETGAIGDSSRSSRERLDEQPAGGQHNEPGQRRDLCVAGRSDHDQRDGGPTGSARVRLCKVHLLPSRAFRLGKRRFCECERCTQSRQLISDSFPQGRVCIFRRALRALALSK